MSGTENGSTSYHRMSVAEKQAYARATVREPAVMCPACDAQTTAADLLTHLETRCTGPRDPGPGSKWVTWNQAIKIVPRETLSRWARTGSVRFKGERQDRQYLLRDLVVKSAGRRRQSHKWDCSSGHAQ